MKSELSEKGSRAFRGPIPNSKKADKAEPHSALQGRRRLIERSGARA